MVVLSKLPVAIDEMARLVVVAAEVVAWRAVKFCKVVEAVMRRLVAESCARTLKAVLVALVSKVLPNKVVEASCAALVALKTPPMVVELRTNTLPVLEIVNRVVLAPLFEVEPIAKRVVCTEVEALCMERLAKGEEVPTPTLPLAKKVVVAVPPK